ncbi:MAG: hypothetical protein ACFFD2_23810 [Promethearchaeota archaeon]
MRKRYRRLVDAPKNEQEKEEFDKFYEEYKEMFKTDPCFIGIICRKLFGNDKNKRVRFGEYAADRTVLELYEEIKKNKPPTYLR